MDPGLIGAPGNPCAPAVAVVAECYVRGVSTRRVDGLVKALGIESLSKTQVSRMVLDAGGFSFGDFHRVEEIVEAGYRSAVRPLDAEANGQRRAAVDIRSERVGYFVGMLHAALRDLVWRRRRYAISVAGTALVLAVGLVMSGISAAFGTELDRTFSSLDVEAFVVPEGVSGPLTGSQPFDVAELPEGVEPMAYLIQTANPAEPEMVAVVGLEPGEAEPEVETGAQLAGPSEALVAGDSGFDVGEIVEVAGIELTVVGHVDGLSVNAGMPMIVIPLATFQESLLGGLPLATAGIVTGTDPAVPPGFKVVGVAEAREDALRILGDAVSTIDLVEALLWIVAALIVGSVMYLSAVERTRDFAVFRAIGTSTSALAGGVALQAVLLALAAAVIGVGLAFLLAPVFPMQVDLTAGALAGLPVLAVLVGVLSGVFALRRAISVEPAEAFSGAT